MSGMEEDDEFGDLYTDVLQPFKSSTVSQPSPPIGLNLQFRDQDSFPPDGFGVNSSSVSKFSEKEVAKLSSPDATRQEIGGDGADTDMKFDIEEADADVLPAIPGLSIPVSEADSLPGLATDRGIALAPTEMGIASDGTMHGKHDDEGDDWDSDSEDDLQIVLNDSSRNGMMGAERRARMGGNAEDDEDDDEDPLVIVADTDPNQALGEQLWEEDSAQVTEGDGKDAGDPSKASGAGGAAAPPKIGYIGPGYHPFHSQFKYVRPGAAPIPGATPSAAGTSLSQARPPMNVGPMAGRGRGDWRPVAQKGYNQGFGAPWGNNAAGRGSGGGLDFTLPSHKTVFEVDIDGFEEKPWRYPGADITDFFNFGMNEESWKDYCKQLQQRRVQTTMQSRIRVYESGRTDQGYDPDLPPELAAATGAQAVPGDSINLLKPGPARVDSMKEPAHVRPPPPPGRPIPVETGSGERLPSIDTRAPRMRDAEAIIEIVCENPQEDEPSTGNGVDQMDASPPEENLAGDTDYVNSTKPDTGSPVKDKPSSSSVPDKHEDEVSENADGRCSLRSSSPIGDKDTRSLSDEQKDEASKGSEMEVNKMSCEVSRSVVQEDDGGESKTERSSESSKVKSGSHRECRQVKDSVEEEVIQDRQYPRPVKSRKESDEIAQYQSRRYEDKGQEMERARVREKSHTRMEIDSSYPPHSYTRGEDSDKRKERDIAGDVWRRREDDGYNRRSGEEGSRKRDRGDDLASRHKGKPDHVPSRKHLDDGGMRAPIDKDFVSRHKEKDDGGRNNYDMVDDYGVKRKKDEGYLRRSRSDKNEITHGPRESMSRLKRERDERLDHQKREAQKIREDFDDHRSFRHRDEFHVPRDRIERQREREEMDDMKQIHEEGSSVRGRERQAAMRSHRGSEDRASRMKDEYRASDKELITNDTSRHSKQQKRRESAYEESSSHHRGHEDSSARTDDVSNEKKLRHERGSTRSHKVNDASDGQRLQEKKHKESRQKSKEHRSGDAMDLGSSRNKQEEQNGNLEEMGPKSMNEGRNNKHETSRQLSSARRRSDDASPGKEQHDSGSGRSKLERWTSQKERDYALSMKSPSGPSGLQEMEKSTNGDKVVAHDSSDKNAGDVPESKDGSQKPPGDCHLDTVEKLKKRSERFKLSMPNEKKSENETLPCAKTEGPVDSEVKAERPTRRRRWTSS